MRFAPGACLLGTLLVLGALGCGGSRLGEAGSARAVARAALHAAAAGDARVLARWLDAAGRARLAAEGSRSLLLAQQAEQRARLEALDAASERVTLRWVAPDGTSREAVLRRGSPRRSFRFLAAVGPQGGAGTPQGALLAWVRWLRGAARGEAHLALLARERRAAWRARIEALLDELQDVEALRWRREGRRARAVTAAGRRIDLVEEGGVWRIDRVGALP